MRLNQSERIRESVWSLTDKLGGYYESQRPREEPVRISTQPMRLTRFADCPLCKRDVNTCECDPDEYQRALLALQGAIEALPECRRDLAALAIFGETE